MRAIIFANGEFTDPQGARDALAAGVCPHVIIGDLDSLSPDEQARLEVGAGPASSHIVRFSPSKDETDLELALLYAVCEGVTEIVILAALGGRLDQTIANLLLLALPELRGLDVRIVAGTQTAFLIQGQGGRDGGDGGDERLIEGQPGDIVSLIPLGGDAVGVTAEGLEWPLHELWAGAGGEQRAGGGAGPRARAAGRAPVCGDACK